jgi:hypothetical protein
MTSKPSETPASEDPLGLTGQWVSVDERRTEVSFDITRVGGAYRVRAYDRSAGEEAEIYDVKTAGDRLTFAAYWSSGQFTKYRLRAVAGQVEGIFTYTDSTHFKRAVDKPGDRDP